MQKALLSIIATFAVAGCLADNERFCDESSSLRAAEYCDIVNNRWTPGPDPNADMSVVDFSIPPDMTIICTSSADCSNPTPICNMAAKKCTACNTMSATDAGTSDECGAKMANQPFCAQGSCVECLGARDCLSKSKTCDPMGACVACKADAECTSRICKSGVCGNPNDYIYVDAAKCPQVGKGTLDDPFCTVKLAISTAASTKKIVIVATGTYRENIEVDSTFFPVVVTLIGQGSPTITSATTGKPILSMTGHDTNQQTLNFEGFTFSMSEASEAIKCLGATPPARTILKLVRSTVSRASSVGIVASSCDVTLDRVQVGPANNGGGISLENSPFSIVNSLISRNGQPQAAAFPSAIGGLRIGSVRDRAEIMNCTVVDNASANGPDASGIICPMSRPLIANTVVFGNMGGKAQINADRCQPNFSAFPGAAAANTGMNNLDLANCMEKSLFVDRQANKYQPAAGGTKPCTLIDQGTNASMGVMAPAIDFDGAMRPAKGGYDIGAYEAQ